MNGQRDGFMKNYDTAWMGYGEADITPVKSVELAGFYRPDNRSRGILHPLRLQTMLWKKGQALACLITVDSLGFTVALSDTLRDRAAKELGTKREHIMLCFSHTHAAPNAAEQQDYFESVCEKAIQSIRNAVARLSPAFAAWGIGENHVGLNRRNAPDSMDRRLGILEFSDPDTNRRKALLLRVTAHANVLFSDNYLISSDYFGITRERLERKYGCKVMMIQGAAGDIRPRFRQDNTEFLEIHGYKAAENGYSEAYLQKYTAQSKEALHQMAAGICDAVEAVIGTLKPEPITYMAVQSAYCRFTADVPSLERAGQIAEEARREAGIDGTAWYQEVERLHKEGIQKQASDIEIQYCFVNGGCLCGVANEAMCRIALDVQALAGTPFLFLNGYTNGCNSYLPTAEEYDKGGYEVLWSNLVYFPYHGRVMPFNRDTAEYLAAETVRNWKRFKA